MCRKEEKSNKKNEYIALQHEDIPSWKRSAENRHATKGKEEEKKTSKALNTQTKTCASTHK